MCVRIAKCYLKMYRNNSVVVFWVECMLPVESCCHLC